MCDGDNAGTQDENVVTGPARDTVVVETDGILHVKCTSREQFVNPTSPPHMTPRQVNETLNLNLGLPIDPENKLLRAVLRFLMFTFLVWWEEYVIFAAYNAIPLEWRRQLCMTLWKYFLMFHRRFLGRRTGIHPAASEEYHALTTGLWIGRLFPVTIPRMRFALSQLSSWTTNVVTSNYDMVQHPMDIPKSEYDTEIADQPTTVKGIYVYSGNVGTLTPTNKVIFWLFGGAFLSGDLGGNLNHAEMVGKRCGTDVYLADYRLLPEASFDDMLWDVLLGYRYLVEVRGVKPSNIVLWGISSGGAHCTRLMQLISQVQRNIPTSPAWLGTLLKPTYMPSGATLLCPFVDFTEPTGSFVEYPKHDLIVNQSVIEEGVPYFEVVLGDGPRRRACSPCYLDFTNLPPLCVTLSEHEAVYDHGVKLINKARSQGVSVTVGVWKYMCHVFCLLDSFCPEGQQSMEFACDWIRNHIKE